MKVAIHELRKRPKKVPGSRLRAMNVPTESSRYRSVSRFSELARFAICKKIAFRHREFDFRHRFSRPEAGTSVAVCTATRGTIMRIIEINRDMDAAAMAEMTPMFEELAASDENICFDLRGVGFVDSSGVGGLVFVLKRLRTRALSVTLCNVKGQPLRLLRQLRLEFLLEAGPPATT